MPATDLNTSSLFWKQIKRKVTNWTTVSRIMSVVLFLLARTILVQFVGQFHQIPSPVAVFAALFQLDLGVIFTEIFRSFVRVMAGFLIGLLIGFPLGVLIGYSRIANYLLFPAVEMVRPIPPIAWIPLTVLFFIEIESQIIFLTFYGAFFPIVYNTMGGSRRWISGCPGPPCRSGSTGSACCGKLSFRRPCSRYSPG